jgi:hypothetical protein
VRPEGNNSDVRGSQNPKAGNPGQDLKNALGRASDKAGEATPDVNIPGFGPYKFNPKEDAKQAKKRIGEAVSALPTESIGQLALNSDADSITRNNPGTQGGLSNTTGAQGTGQNRDADASVGKALDRVKGALGSASDKAGEATPDVNIPGFGPYKFNPKEDAKQAKKRIDEVSFAPSEAIGNLAGLPGSGISRSDDQTSRRPEGDNSYIRGPQNPKAGDAGKDLKNALGRASDKAGEATPNVNIPGFGPYKFNPKEDAKQAKKRIDQVSAAPSEAIGNLAGLPGSGISRSDDQTSRRPEGDNSYIRGPQNPKAGDAGKDLKNALGKASDKAGEATPDVNIPGFGPYKFNPKEDAKQAKKRIDQVSAAPSEAIGNLAGLPGSNVSRNDDQTSKRPEGDNSYIRGPQNPKAGDAGKDIKNALGRASDKAGEATPDVNIPGFGPYKFNPKEDAKQAKKRIDQVSAAPSEAIGNLAGLPGSGISRNDDQTSRRPEGDNSYIRAPQNPKAGDAGKDLKNALGRASDKAGEATPDVNIPGFGPYKFNPKEDAKQAQKNLAQGPLNKLAGAVQRNTPGVAIADLAALDEDPKITFRNPVKSIGEAVGKVTDLSGEAERVTSGQKPAGFTNEEIADQGSRDHQDALRGSSNVNDDAGKQVSGSSQLGNQ